MNRKNKLRRKLCQAQVKLKLWFMLRLLLRLMLGLRLGLGVSGLGLGVLFQLGGWASVVDGFVGYWRFGE